MLVERRLDPLLTPRTIGGNSVRAPEHPVPPGRAPLFAAILAAAAAVSYGSFLLEHALSPDLDRFNGYVSELSARDQPFHYLYSAGDLITGSLAIIVSVTALLTLRRRPWSTAGWIFLGKFGFWAIGDAVFPLDCAPSLETTCALRERSGHVSFSHQFHSVTSVIVIIFGVLALFTLSMAARRYGWWPALGRWGWLLAVIEVVCALATLALMLVGLWLGLMQRLQIGVLCLGLLVISWALYADRHRTEPDPPDTTPAGTGDTEDPGPGDRTLGSAAADDGLGVVR